MKLQRSPLHSHQVKDALTGNPWWWFSLITTVLFIPFHLFVLGLLFFNQSDLSLTTYLWSGLQLALAVYSYLLLLAPTAVQIVLLYLRYPVRIILALYLSCAVVMLLITLGILMTDTLTGDETQKQTLFSIFYQTCINGPTIMFMVPLFAYIGVIDTYMAATYPGLYKNNSMFDTILPQTHNMLMSEGSEGKIKLVIIS